jgi:lipopolysaccharide/colanic/teichoic acid biosynthesis glycosyltransferase
VYLSGTEEIVVDRAALQYGLAHTVALGRAARQRAPRLDMIRVLDVLIALIVLIFMLPAMVVVALAIKMQDGGPILFKQTRLGYGGATFKCWKFRTMVVDAEARLNALLAQSAAARLEWAADQKLRNDPRITWLGEFLRKSSLDELPQIFNVLKGEMSLVGPRPIVMGEVEKYGRWFRHYCAVRPGVTGLWQISGRNDVSYARRVMFDVAFARCRSVSLYLRILVATLPAVLPRNRDY